MPGTPNSQDWQGLLAAFWASPFWEGTKSLANANFTTALLGSLAGAFAGAYVAQRIAERHKERDELLRELRSTNAAITLAFTVCNSLLSLKRQHLRDMLSTFEAERNALLEHKRKRDIGQIQGNAAYRFRADFRNLPTTVLPTDTLRDTVLSKVSAHARPLSLVASIVEYSALLNGAIVKRNELSLRFRSLVESQDPDVPARYFGLPYQGGHIDAEYSDALLGIGNYADDVIFYSYLLCQDLFQHGTALRKRFEARHGSGAPKVSEVKFDEAKASGLLPDESHYKSWMTAFVREQ